MIKWSLKNSIVIILLAIIVIVSGVLVTGNLKLETIPDVSNPVLTVQANQAGASAEDIEENVTKPLENTIKQQNDYESFTSTSSDNIANIQIVYPFGTDLDKKEQELNNNFSKLVLPEQADFQIKRINLDDFPVYSASLSTKYEADLQKELEDKIIPELEKKEGINEVTIKGTKTSTVAIKVNLEKAKAKGLTLGTIQQSIQNEEYALPAGSAETKDNTIAVRLVGNIQKVADLKNIPIIHATTGANPQLTASASPVKLGDIAEINTTSEQTEISKVNGESAFQIEVTKDQDANTTDVSKFTRDILSKYQQNVAFKIHPIADQGAETEKSINSLIHEALYGAIFVVLIIALFLRNLRATIIALISIPLSILVTLTLMEPMGYTLNIMTLGGMAVAVGRIVDDSIVVIENIFRWKQQKRETLSQKQLVLHATKEVGTAVASSTFVTIAVFLPLVFVTGMIGEIFRPFALTVAISILVSLLVAFTLIPLLGASFFKKVPPHSEDTRLSRIYGKMLDGALRQKTLVIAASLFLLIGSLAMIPRLGFSFLPTGDAELVTSEITLPAGTTLGATEELAKKLEQKIKEMNLFDKRQVTIGMSNMLQIVETNEQKITFSLERKEDISLDDALTKLEKEITKISQGKYPKAKVKISEQTQAGPGSGNDIKVNLYGNNLKNLAAASGQVEDLFNQNKDLKNISNTSQETRKAWNITLNQEGKELGLTPEQVMATVHEHLQLLKVGTYKLDGLDQNIVLEYNEKVSTEAKLKAIKIQTTKGEKALSDIADIKLSNVPASILHENGETYTTVSALIKGDDPLGVTDQVKQDIDALSLPSGVTIQVGGGNEDITEGLTNLGISIVIAIGLVFIILSITYGGILTPLVILSSLLFVPIGAISGLLLTGQPISMSVMIGLLMLVGIVVTNAIVLLDRVETKRKAGLDLGQAIMEAAKTRLRPILMTALATIFALIPLAMSTDSSLLISQGLAITVIGGLTTSTLLTLFFVPVLYAIVGKYRRIETTDSIKELEKDKK
ncbi:efflux RND transporter permease subunit [Shimazuella kribbensis]|uniref:efflux RND transporter permease subunit n=1 Tax=Shimazuella kribbensis TaxID=139808 RepID=UPI00041ADC89|nr:efflux RND transporter permease subunit [Shimazuella kribbensis]